MGPQNYLVYRLLAETNQGRMMATSLCGCLKIPEQAYWLDLATRGRRTNPSRFRKSVAQHYQDYPECLKKARQDPVWELRETVPTETIE